MADVLVDTDASIDHLRGAAELRAGRHRLHYSVITREVHVDRATAPALEHRLEIATRNARDFGQVRGLRVRQLS